MQTLRILSLNTFGAPVLSKNISKRFHLIADILNGEEADIICLQEVVLYPHLRLLKKLFPEYSLHYKRFLYGPKGGLVILCRLPVADRFYIDFIDRGSLLNKSFVGRIMRYGVLGIRCRGLPITICNTHIMPNLDVEYNEGNKYLKFQTSQLRQVAKILHDEWLWKRDVVIAGDFNMPHDSALYEDFVRISGLMNVFQSYETPTKHDAYMPEGMPSHRIDYIFYSTKQSRIQPKLADHILEHPLQQDGETFYLSDHIGLKAELEITSTHHRNFTNN